MDKVPVMGGVMAAGLGSLASTDELQALLVSLFAVAVREFIYWWRNRRKSSDLELPPSGG